MSCVTMHYKYFENGLMLTKGARYGTDKNSRIHSDKGYRIQNTEQGLGMQYEMKPLQSSSI